MRTTQVDYRTEALILAVSLELSSSSWKVAFHDGRCTKARVVTCCAEGVSERLSELMAEIAKVRRRWSLDEQCRIETSSVGHVRPTYPADLCPPTSAT